MTRPMALRWSPAVAFYRVELKEAEELLIAWRHPLHLPDDEYPQGRPYTRPFGRLPFVMEDRGRPAAVVVIASSVNTSVARDRDLHRYIMWVTHACPSSASRKVLGGGRRTPAGPCPGGRRKLA
jgi:hypothetical protein